MTTENNEKSRIKFYCKECDYLTLRKDQYDRHLSTPKHTRTTTLTTNDNAKVTKSYLCTNCEKKFNDRAGLWRHKNKCNITIVTDSNAELFDKDKLIIMLINQNAELIKETSEFTPLKI